MTSEPVQRFRTPATVISGLAYLALGVAALGTGAALLQGARSSHRLALVFALVLVLVGAVMAASGLGRILARLEVGPTKLVWYWDFSRHEVAVADTAEAALIEPGTVDVGFPGGLFRRGLLVRIFWAVFRGAVLVLHVSPTLGARTLVIVPRYGEAVRVMPIGTFATDPSSTRAFAAQQAIQAVIHTHRPSPLACDPPSPDVWTRSGLGTVL
jgi:hypothetical protein